jgi:hypothetical protein
VLYKTAHFFVFVSRSREIACAEYALPIRAELRANARIVNDFGHVPEHGDEMDFVVNDVRVKSTGIKSFPRGQKHGPWRPDRIRIEDIEDNANRMSPTLQAKYYKVITDDIMKSVGAGIDEPWSVIFNGNYFSRRSLLHRVRLSGQFVVTIIKALRPLREGEVNPQSVDGETSTWPERFPTAQLVADRAKAPITFKIEMQQEPEDDEGTFRRQWFATYAERDVQPEGPQYLGRYGWVDPSSGESSASDYKAYGYADFYSMNQELHMYLRAARCRRQTINEMISTLFEMQRRSWPQVRMWGFEAVAAEEYLLRLLQQRTVSEGLSLPVFPIMKNFPGFPWKKDRIPQMQSPAERGFCHFLKGDPDHERIIEQYCDWPDADNDDGPDMHSGLWKLGEMLTVGQSVLC